MMGVGVIFGTRVGTIKEKPVSNPATQVYITDLNEPVSENTENQRPERTWLWRVRSALGLLPKRQACDRDLRLAIRTEDMDEVMRLLEAGVTPSKFPDTPWLCLAARRQNRVLLELLLIHGAQVDQPDRDTRGARGRTAIHEAAKRGWEKGAKLLLESGANPNQTDDFGQTPLFLAVRRGHAKVAAQLLEAGAKLTSPTGSAQFLLHEATSAEAVDLLVHAGANVNEPDARGFAPLHQQTKAGRAEVVKRLLFHRAQVNVLDRHGRTAGFWLGAGQAKECLEALLNAGLDLAVRDVDGGVAAHFIPLRTRCEELLQALYRSCPDGFVVKNNQGETPLFVLARSGRMELADKIEADLKSRPAPLP